MKFAKAYEETKDSAQKYDKTKMMYIKGGQELNRFDEIQAANVDTNIYEVLEKYNLQPDVETAAKLYNDLGKMQGIFDDVTDIQRMGSMGDIKMAQIRAKEAFENLPLEIRNNFDNDYSKFIQNGNKFIQAKIAEYQEKNKPAPQPTPTPSEGDK